MIQPCTEILFQPLEDEIVLLSLSTEEYYSMDKVSGRMWQLLIEHKEIEPVIKQILTEFNTDETTVRRDLQQLITDCKSEGLLCVN